MVFVYDGSLGSNPRKFLYVNGTQIDSYSANGNILTTTADLKMGKRFNNRWYEGILDEMRVSDNARSADWICTEFNSQDSPSTFFIIEDEQLCLPAVIGGTATPDDFTIFAGESTTVRLSGTTGSIQWQESTDNVTFADIGGQTMTTLNTGALSVTTYFRAIVSNGSCQTASSVATVNVKVSTITNYSYRKKIIC